MTTVDAPGACSQSEQLTARKTATGATVAGAESTPAPARIAGPTSVTVAAPQKKIEQKPPSKFDEKAWEDFAGLYMKYNPGKYVKGKMGQLAGALSDRNLTREEFNEIFGAHFTKEAWEAFGGGYQIATVNELLHFMEQFDDYSAATGGAVSFDYFSQSTTIIFSPELTNLISQIRTKDPVALRAMCKSHADLIRRILAQLGCNLPSAREAREPENEVNLVDEVEMVCADDKKARRFDQMMAAVLIQEMSSEAMGLGLDRLDWKDPLVARKFGAGVFKDYASGTNMSPSSSSIDALKDFQKQVKRVVNPPPPQRVDHVS